MQNKIRNASYKIGFEPIRVKFTPTDAVLKTCEEAGTDFAQELKKAKRKSKKVRQTQGLTSDVDRTAQAVGRLVGSMCIVTTKREELSGAMLASWVSQATFNPPGLTIAVAKERAIESLLYKGNSFVLNVLPEGNHIPLM